MARTIRRKINKLFASIVHSKSGRTILIGFFKCPFYERKKKDDIKFFFYVCVFFPLRSGFSFKSPRRPGTILRGSCFLFSALVVNVFNDISVGSTTRHSQHTDNKGSQEKEGLHYYCASYKEKPQRKKQKRQGWWSPFAVCKSPDGVRFRCLRLSAEPIGAVYLEEEEEREKGG